MQEGKKQTKSRIIQMKDKNGRGIVKVTVDENGVGNGPAEFRGKDGSYAIFFLKNNEIHGNYERHYPNGSYEVGQYKNNLPIGKFKTYNENGLLEGIDFYRNGKLVVKPRSAKILRNQARERAA